MYVRKKVHMRRRWRMKVNNSLYILEQMEDEVLLLLKEPNVERAARRTRSQTE